MPPKQTQHSSRTSQHLDSFVRRRSITLVVKRRIWSAACESSEIQRVGAHAPVFGVPLGEAVSDAWRWEESAPDGDVERLGLGDGCSLGASAPARGNATFLARYTQLPSVYITPAYWTRLHRLPGGRVRPACVAGQDSPDAGLICRATCFSRSDQVSRGYGVRAHLM